MNHCLARISLLAVAVAAAGTSCSRSDEIADACELRRAEAFNPNQPSFGHEFIRWSCADTPTISGVERGQEYCEYFAIVDLPVPPESRLPSSPIVLGRLWAVPAAVDDNDDPRERDVTYGTTRHDVPLESDVLTALEAAGPATVGQCVFTSWNEDYFIPPPLCAPGNPGPCPSVMGIPVEAQNFRMKQEVNSNEAAQYLLEDCYFAVEERPSRRALVEEQEQDEQEAEPEQAPAGDDVGDEAAEDAEDAEDAEEEAKEPPRDHPDDFIRGCYLNASINETWYRKSDSFLCAASMRLSECGCVVADESPLVDVLSPYSRRGFPLGTWSAPDQLPAGCRYVELGDGSRTVVSCDISASEVINYASDVKRLCREKYAPNVVVHVPIPGQGLVCEADLGDPDYLRNCGATPWIPAP